MNEIVRASIVAIATQNEKTKAIEQVILMCENTQEMVFGIFIVSSKLYENNMGNPFVKILSEMGRR